ncbi:MAG: hypothetical protein AAGF01_06005 [Cyanobacteria bacterium P01_G01_bin.38]
MWSPFSQKNSIEKTLEDFGQYLPEENAKLQNGYEIIEASTSKQAKKRCKDIASEYDGFGSKTRYRGGKEHDCTWKLWG